MSAVGWRRIAKRANRGDPGVETIVIGEIEVKRDRPCCGAALYYVEPNGFTATVDQQMLALRSAHCSRVD